MFWEQFWPQLIATLVGAALGIPAGIGLERWLAKRRGKERKNEILNQIEAELSINHEIITDYKSKEVGDIESGTLGIKLTTEAWKAYSEGGELGWIKNPYTLFYLSLTYHQINVVKKYSDKFYDLTIIGGRRMSLHSIKYLTEQLDNAVAESLFHVERTIDHLGGKV